ncbi:hypothetical protein ACHAXT_003351 [Thalassiosira profunda]
MEKGQPVWLRSTASRWGWVPALVHNREEVILKNGITVLQVTLRDDPRGVGGRNADQSQKSSGCLSPFYDQDHHRSAQVSGGDGYYADIEPFEITLTIDIESAERDELEDIKIRDNGVDAHIVGGVDDLIGLTHLHEPAILHALRLRYDSDIIYTSTGPILIAINPFKSMPLYTDEVMEQYRQQGEMGFVSVEDKSAKGKKGKKKKAVDSGKRLPPHAYLTADDAYRAMMRGIEMALGGGAARKEQAKRRRAGDVKASSDMDDTPTNQSILVSGESGAGKTVTTKIVLNYFAMLSKLADSRAHGGELPEETGQVRVEQQVLDSNPILEAFGNARTIRNDNSSRFGKYIDIRFGTSGKLTGATIDTYLLEKVRLIHQTEGERNFHVFYQFLESASEEDRDDYFLGDMQLEDFALVNQSGTYDRRDMVSDVDMHTEMIDAMGIMGFSPEMTRDIMRLVVAVLYAGNMTFTDTNRGENCILDENEASLAVASLLGVSYEKLAASLTSRVLFLKEGNITKELNAKQAYKASEALIKAVYGANFDYIVKIINQAIHNEQPSGRGKAARGKDQSAYIGVLDIFGFETFETNTFEQLCINYTNETLQQHFNKHVFKMEQQEYEREGILWKFISFPDNQDVLDLIDMKRVGILAVLDEQCIVEWGSDDKFCQNLYQRCGPHDRFEATPAQRPYRKFGVDHYAGMVEYSTAEWVEKNKDQLPAASVELLMSSDFSHVGKLQSFVRAEGAGGRGSVAMKSVGAKFAEQLRNLRQRIDATAPHYIRCLKPNDELLPDEFDPKQIVEQLRYSGVLEAVRVSRAGYPTRYPHGQFMSRYYMLGDLGQDGTKRNKDMVQLAKFIAKHVWEADIRKTRVREELAIQQQMQRKGSGRYAMKKAQSSRTTVKKKKRMNAQSNIDIPETEEEFEKLDFGTRCAVAGLQLGRTKVFLRREAFDRIESLRVAILGKSARVIQAKMRGRVQRMRYLRLRESTIKCQAMIRYFLANLEFIRARNKARKELWGSTKIQKAYRQYKFRNLGADRKRRMVEAAIAIQAFTRGSLARLHLEDIWRNRPRVKKEVEEVVIMPEPVVVVRTGPTEEEINAMLEAKAKMFSLLHEEKWDEALELMEEHEETKLAEQQEEGTGMLPLHIVAQHNLHTVFTKVYKMFPEGEDKFDYEGRLPMHVAAEYDALVPVKSLLDKHPEGAETMMLRPTGRSGGGIPLHVACRVNASGATITALLSSNFNSTKKSDANGDLPIHLLLRNGKDVSGAVVQALLDTYPTAATRADMYGDLPLSVALKHECKPEVVKTLLMHNPDAAKVQNGRDGHSPLFLAFQHHADDKTILGLMNHAPDVSLIVAVDKRTGMLPIEMATKQKHSKTIVYDLLKRDLPIDMKEKTEAKLVPHQYSWNHIVSDANDLYHDVMEKVLQQCSQPQVVALAHVENKRGEIPLATATPLCKHEFRVMFRLFQTLEVVDQTPAFEDKESGTQIFYALRFTPPKEKPGYFTTLYHDDKSTMNAVEEWDDTPVAEDEIVEPDLSEMDVKEKLEFVQNEKGVKVIAKLTSRSDIVDAELSKRKDHDLSRNYVPAIISVHHTMQHAAYSEAMADPSYCITMEAADITAENLILDTRRAGGTFPKDDLKGMAMSLLHIHEHGLIHGDFGSHNTAKFGDRWKTLGVRGSVDIGHMTDPKRGFFQPPEAVSLETRNVSLGDKNVGANLIPIAADVTYDIWAYGVIFYEAVAGLPLSPYRSLHKAKRALTTAELFKVGQWDERALRKALRHIDGNDKARDLAKKSMREVLEHPFFGLGKLAGKAPVFKRPELGAQSDTNAMDINAYTDEHLANRHEYIAEAEEKAKTPKKEEVPAVIQVEEEPEEEEVEEEPEVVAEPEPAPEVGTCKAEPRLDGIQLPPEVWVGVLKYLPLQGVLSCGAERVLQLLGSARRYKISTEAGDFFIAKYDEVAMAEIQRVIKYADLDAKKINPQTVSDAIMKSFVSDSYGSTTPTSRELCYVSEESLGYLKDTVGLSFSTDDIERPLRGLTKHAQRIISAFIRASWEEDNVLELECLRLVRRLLGDIETLHPIDGIEELISSLTTRLKSTGKLQEEAVRALKMIVVGGRKEHIEVFATLVLLKILSGCWLPRAITFAWQRPTPTMVQEM